MLNKMISGLTSNHIPSLSTIVIQGIICMLLIILFIVFLLFAYTMYCYINEKLHPFSGRIETFKDVNDFIANYYNYKGFHFKEGTDSLDIMSVEEPIRAFVWEHKDAINYQLEKDREEKDEKKNKEKEGEERMIKLEKLDNAIRHSNNAKKVQL
jgi:hypothetical protein